MSKENSHKQSIFLTVFTPTFNRSRNLFALYKSLEAQTCTDFEWLVVDDGSTDGTRELIGEWKKEATFPIRYKYQENSGKHVAHNLGAKEANGAYFVCVDSDDWLEPNAVEIIKRDVQPLDSKAGLIYPKLFTSRNSLDTRKWFPSTISSIQIADMRLEYGLSIETTIVFNTNVLRKHPFPSFNGENFIPEGSAYYDFKKPEIFFQHPDCIYRCEYQQEGLTKNIWSHWLKNPRGTKYALGKRYQSSKQYSGRYAFKERISAIAGIESINMALKHPLFEDLPDHSLLALIVLPLSFYLKNRRFRSVSLESTK